MLLFTDTNLGDIMGNVTKDFNFAWDTYRIFVNVFFKNAYTCGCQTIRTSECDCVNVRATYDFDAVPNGVHVEIKKVSFAYPTQVSVAQMKNMEGNVSKFILENYKNIISVERGTRFHGDTASPKIRVNLKWNLITGFLFDEFEKTFESNRLSHTDLISKLEKEYDYVSPVVKNTNAAKTVILSEHGFFNEVKNSDSFIVSKSVPCFDYDYDSEVAGILLVNSDKSYTLIDGRARILNALKQSVEKMIFHVLYRKG